MTSTLFTEPMTDDRRVLMPYDVIMARGDDSITISVNTEDGSKICVEVPATEGVCIRRDRCLVLPRWLVLSKGLDRYCVPFSMTAIKLGSMAVKSGTYSVKSEAKGALVLFDIKLSPVTATWMFAGSRILSYRTAADGFEKPCSIGYVGRHGLVPFNSVVTEGGQRLAFFRAFKALHDTPLAMAGKLRIEKFQQCCAACDEVCSSFVCGSTCAVASGVDR